LIVPCIDVLLPSRALVAYRALIVCVSSALQVVNSKYDTWQEKAILGLQCAVTKCTNATQESFWVSYGQAMVKAAQAMPSRHGAFLTNCPAHCQTGTGGDWVKRSVNSTAVGVAVATWFNQTVATMDSGSQDATPAPRWIETCNEKPCGPDVC
jgi:hypothetical protein